DAEFVTFDAGDLLAVEGRLLQSTEGIVTIVDVIAARQGQAFQLARGLALKVQFNGAPLSNLAGLVDVAVAFPSKPAQGVVGKGEVLIFVVAFLQAPCGVVEEATGSRCCAGILQGTRAFGKHASQWVALEATFHLIRIPVADQMSGAVVAVSLAPAIETDLFDEPFIPVVNEAINIAVFVGDCYQVAFAVVRVVEAVTFRIGLANDLAEAIVFIPSDPAAPVTDAFDLAVCVVADVDGFAIGVLNAGQFPAAVVVVAGAAAVLVAGEPEIRLDELTPGVVSESLPMALWIDQCF